MRIATMILGAAPDSLSREQKIGRAIVAVGALVLGAMLSMVSLIEYRYRAHSDKWLVVRSVNVPDVVAGIEPTLLVERTIVAPFWGDWVATIRRFDDRGPVIVCSGSGRSNYAVDAQLPSPLPLGWWMGRECPLAPGVYRLDTTWKISPPGYPAKIVHRSSNIFQVR